MWDKQGNASAWSEPAAWIVGLLEAGEWKAEWIGSDKLREVKSEQPSLDGAKWICFPAEGIPPAGGQLLVTTWTLPADIVIKQAELDRHGRRRLQVCHQFGTGRDARIVGSRPKSSTSPAGSNRVQTACAAKYKTAPQARPDSSPS